MGACHGASLYVGVDEGSSAPSGRPLRPKDTGGGDPVRRAAPRPMRRSRGVSQGQEGACIQGQLTLVQGRGTGLDDETREVPMSSHEIVGIDVAAKTLVAVGEEVVLLASYENTADGRAALIKALRRSKR